MKNRKITALLLGMAVAVSSFSTVQAAETGSTPATIAPADSLDLAGMFSEKDLDDSRSDAAVRITLEDTAAKAEDESVQIDGKTVTITEAGTYVLSGTLTDGQIIVETEETEDVRLILDGVTITNDDSACIFVKSGDKVVLTLAEGSENVLSDTGAEYVQPDEGSTVDGVIFSREDLSVNGTGSLTVEAGYKHGIVCKDDLAVTGGTITVDAADKGIVGEDSVRIKDGTITVTSADDAVCSDTSDKEGKGFIYIEGGSLELAAGDDGIHAETSLLIAGGTIDVTESKEGLEGATVDITDGDIRIKAQDDGINAAYKTSGAAGEASDSIRVEDGGMGMTPPEDMGGQRMPDGMPEMPEDMQEMRAGRHGSPGGWQEMPDGMPEMPDGMPEMPDDWQGMRGDMQGMPGGMQGMPGGGFGMMDALADCYLRISGGTIFVDADGDGLDSNGYLYLDGGTVVVEGPTNDGNGALDYGIDAVVSGGTLIATGSAGMAQAFGSASTQSFLYYSFDQTISAGTEVTITDEDGSEVYVFTPGKDFRNIIYTAPELEKGAVYEIAAGSGSGTAEAGTEQAGYAGMQGGGMMPGQPF